ncbi:N-acetylglucosamine-6-phosphate deacetylase [Ammoniphilus sp. 3BR4]|uniref:N-acetylglucosamine-6-phosphate deacetylase n=1 Tax=Ammoniphilus sp. 3BR4 TaxID=3158265 RepID=UPI00346719C0
MRTERLVLRGARIYGEEDVIEQGYLVVDKGRITEIGRGERELPNEVQLPTDWTIIPGMIDVHIHGAAGADTMDATPESISTMAEALPAEGTTAFLATTMTQEEVFIEQALKNVAFYIEEENQLGKAEVLGIHLEGPFISPKRAGAQPVEAIRLPDVALFRKWQELARGHIRLVTLAPEREGGLELAAHLKETGVVASIGHSDATYEEAVEAVKAGVCHATHLFNGMRGLHHREPGVVGAVLLHKEITTELIADGIHVRPEMLDLTFRQKTSEKLILITDAMRAKCLGDGTYSLGGQAVQVANGQAVLEDGTLAGSIVKMRDAAIHMMSATRCDLRDIVRMTSENPAKQLGLFDRKGSLRPGKDADLVVLDEQLRVKMTYCRGKLAYRDYFENVGSEHHPI